MSGAYSTTGANGLVGAFARIAEPYLLRGAEAPGEDRRAEATLCALVALAPTLREDTEENAFYLGRLAGDEEEKGTAHQIARQLTASFGLAPAQTVAVILPSLLRHQFRHTESKLAQFGRQVWNLDGAEQLAERAIDATEAFFRSVGVTTKLADYPIDPRGLLPIPARVIAACGGSLGKIGRVEVGDIIAASL